MSDDMQGQLASYCARAFPVLKGIRVAELAEISAGWESEMYSFAIESGSAGTRKCDELILRIYPGENAHDKSAREFRGMSLLFAAGYPVPQVLVLEREDSPFGKPFVIMEKIQGQMMWPVWFGSPEEKRKEMLTQFCDLFVRLHTLEWRPFVQDVTLYDTGNPYALMDRELTRMRPFVERFPIPGFLPVAEWLEERRDLVPCERPSVIHWDYHPGNILLCDDGSAVVVDWTQVDVSDSRFDLAWSLLLLSTYEGKEWHERILHEYERRAGAKVEQLDFFEVYACVKRLYSVVATLTYGPEALGIRPGAETMMTQHMGALKAAYDSLLANTSIQVPEVEKLW